MNTDGLKEFLAGIGKDGLYKEGATIKDFFKTQPKSEEMTQKEVIVRDIVTESDLIYIVPLYDVHVGAKTCYLDLFKRTVEYIYNTSDCYTIIGGDMMESATKISVGLGMTDEDFHLQDQRHLIQTLLEPLADEGKILGSVTGNHENRVTYFNEDNPMKELAWDLGIPFLGYQGYFVLIANGIEYKVFVHHGTGNAGTRGAKVNAAARPSLIANADLYITGHLHDRFAYPASIFEIEDYKLVQKQRWFVAAGSFLNYFGGYPEMQMLMPASAGTLLIEFGTKQKEIHVHI